MKLTGRFLIVFFVNIMLFGCASKEKKEAKKASITVEAQKNFQRVTPPVLFTDPKDRASYLATHFWDNFDFKDTTFCSLPTITEQAFVDFISVFPITTTAKVSEGVKKLLNAAEVEEVMYNYFFKLGERYLYDPNSPYRNDEFFIPFLEHIVESSKVVELAKARPQELLKLAYRNRPGSKAEDFVYTTASGATGRLHTLSARYILLMFYNPDCKECKLTTDEIRRSTEITAAVSSGKMKVVGVYPDENLEAWRNHLNDYPSSWINSYDKASTIKNNQIYDLKAIPTLYLLDEKKNVLLKDATVGQIHEFLKSNK